MAVKKEERSEAQKTKLLEKWLALRASGATSDKAAEKVGVHQSRLYYWKALKDGTAKPRELVHQREAEKNEAREANTNGRSNGHKKRVTGLPRVIVKRETGALQSQVRELKAELALWKRVANAALQGKL